MDELPEDTEIAAVCVAGVTSARAAEFLREHGFDARSIDGGMNGWGRVHRQYDLEESHVGISNWRTTVRLSFH